MIKGHIGASGPPVVTLQVVGTTGRTTTLEGILGRGFDGFLSQTVYLYGLIAFYHRPAEPLESPWDDDSRAQRWYYGHRHPCSRSVSHSACGSDRPPWRTC